MCIRDSNRITTKTSGNFADGSLSIEQDLFQENKNPSHRTFKLKLIDAHHIEATGSDISGIAHGALYLSLIHI